MCMFAYIACMYTTCMPSSGGQKKVSDRLELEL